MSIVDITICLLVISCAIMGFKRGVIKEAVSLIGIILVFFLAFSLKEPLGNFLCKYFPFFTFHGKLEGISVINIVIYQALSFFVIYSILLSIYTFILKLSGIVQKLVNFTFVLLLPSKIAGGILGLLKGYIVLFILLLVFLIPFKHNSLVQESKLIPKILNTTPVLSKKTESIRKPIEEVYTLTEQVANEEISKNDANLKILDAMLEYKVVNKKTIEQLIVLDKLKGIKGIDKVIAKYE